VDYEPVQIMSQYCHESSRRRSENLSVMRTGKRNTNFPRIENCPEYGGDVESSSAENVCLLISTRYLGGRAILQWRESHTKTDINEQE
jgi:hypothetical protein